MPESSAQWTCLHCSNPVGVWFYGWKHQVGGQSATPTCSGKPTHVVDREGEVFSILEDGKTLTHEGRVRPSRRADRERPVGDLTCVKCRNSDCSTWPNCTAQEADNEPTT